MNRYGAPTTYKRITPARGCGFILKRIYDLTENPDMPRGTYCKNPTKQDIYCGTSWANRPGFASLLWSSLIKDGMIDTNGGMQEYKYHCFYKHPHVGTRAIGHYEAGNGYTVRYHLTPKGRGILFDMMERRMRQNADKLAFCKRNGIQFGAGKTLNAVGSVAEYDAKKDNGRDILEKEALDCAKLAADYAGENQKLRAEKDNTNARLKSLYHRLDLLECDIQALKSELNNIVDWTK